MRDTGRYLILALALALTACGQGNADGDAASVPPETAAAEAPAAVPVQPVAATAASDASGPLQLADLDAYATGMQKEIELIEAASDKAAKAHAAQDTDAETAALMEATSRDIDQAGADAAGMDLARYGHVKNAIDTSLNLVMLHAAAAKQAAGGQEPAFADPYRGMDPDVAAALKSRHDELDGLRTKAMAIRMRMAGA
jgi:hypothetical protein